jgi:hypothetical protein
LQAYNSSPFLQISSSNRNRKADLAKPYESEKAISLFWDGFSSLIMSCGV